MSSLVRRAPLAALSLLLVACADPFSPAAPRRTVSADLLGSLPPKTAQIMCGTYIVAYSPPLIDSALATSSETVRALSLSDDTLLEMGGCGAEVPSEDNR